MSNLLEIAFKEYNTKEIVGKKHNPEVLKYFNDIGFEWVKDDETAWCSAFVNWVCKKANKPYTKKLTARSWLGIGEEVKEPKLGDVAVLWRVSPNSWKGHVGFFVKEDKNYVYLLGGNQSNKVCIKPYLKSRVLKYTRV